MARWRRTADEGVKRTERRRGQRFAGKHISPVNMSPRLRHGLEMGGGAAWKRVGQKVMRLKKWRQNVGWEKKCFLCLTSCDGQNVWLWRMTLKKKDSDGRDSAPNAAKTGRG